MVEKMKYIQTPLFKDPDGTKFGINPFAAVETDYEANDTEEACKNEETSPNCIHCDLTFLDTTEYEHHMIEMHNKKKLLTCKICTATFGRQDHLKRHFKSIHINQKYCTCPVCGKDCKRQDILANHIKETHSDTAVVFHCRECEFQCKTIKALEKHESSHSLTERHVCEHCEVTFKRRDHMLRHVKSQHLNHLVSCPICGQSYKRRDHVARHVREKHKMGLLHGKLVTSLDLLRE